MTNLYDAFGEKNIDPEDTLTIEIGESKFFIKFGGEGNDDFVKEYEKVIRRFRKQDHMIEAGRLNNEAADQVLKSKAKALSEVYADHIIVGWENVTDKDGKTLKFNRENVIKLLSDLPRLFAIIVDEARTEANFKELVEEKEEKNSEKS